VVQRVVAGPSRRPHRRILSRPPGPLGRSRRGAREGACVPVEEASPGPCEGPWKSSSRTRRESPTEVSEQPRQVPLRGVRSKRTRVRQSRTPPRSDARRTGRGRLWEPIVGDVREVARWAFEGGHADGPPRGGLDSQERGGDAFPTGRIGGSLRPVSGPPRACLPRARGHVGVGSKSTVTVVSARVAAVSAGLRPGYAGAGRGSGNVPARGAVSRARAAVRALPGGRPVRADARAARR
jgi:hypothetical protein